MSWPTASVNTTNLDATGDVPANARADLLDMAQKVNLMIGVEPVGRLIGIQVFTSSGTYTPSAGTKSVLVDGVGAGAGSGYCPATGAAQAAASGGGSSGSYGRGRYTTGFSGVTVTIGSGGAGGTSSSAAQNGGTTSFGSLLSCPGGVAGSAGVVRSSFPAYGGPGGAIPADSTGGIHSQKGNRGDQYLFVGYLYYTRTAPPNSAMGVADFSSAGYGAGGPGVYGFNGDPATDGIAGSSGKVIVYEFS